MNRYYTLFRYCPRCGAEYNPDDFDNDAVAWRCRQCAFVFYQNSTPSATAVIPKLGDDHRVILLTRDTDPRMGLLALPGGFLNYGEAPAAGAHREALEEVGLDVTIVRFLESTLVDYEFLGTRLWTLELAFLAEPVDADVSRVTTEEAQSVAFYDVAELLAAPERLAFPEQQTILGRYQALLETGRRDLH